VSACDAALEDAGGNAAPAAMQGGDGADARRDDVDGHAVGHGHGEQHARLARDVAVRIRTDEESARHRVVHQHVGAMHLPRVNRRAQPSRSRS
jgi:hypothetical protein